MASDVDLTRFLEPKGWLPYLERPPTPGMARLPPPLLLRAYMYACGSEKSAGIKNRFLFFCNFWEVNGLGSERFSIQGSPTVSFGNRSVMSNLLF